VRLPAANPIAAFFGPIFQKEVRSAGRRRSTYLLRAAYTLGMLALVVLAYLSSIQQSLHQSAVQRVQELQMLAPIIAMFAMWFQFVALTLIGPMLTSPAICDERRARSLSTLLTTPLTAGQIVLGKISSRLVQVVILSLLGAPVLLALRVFGGLEASIILAFTAVTLTTALLGAALGLLYSMWHTRASSAALFALLTLVLIQGGPPAIDAVIYYLADKWAPSLPGQELYRFHPQTLVTVSPNSLFRLTLSVFMGTPAPNFEINWPWLYDLLKGPGGSNVRGFVTIAPYWVVSCLYNLLCAGLISAASVVTLRRVMTREGAGGASPAATPRRAKRSRAAQPAPPGAQAQPTALDEPTRDRALSRSVGDRPVLWRELRRSAIRSRLLRIAVMTIALGGLALLYLTAGLEEEGLHMTMAILGALIIMVQAVFTTTGNIAAEREGRTWEVLLTTPLSGREIVLSKFAGALRAQWFLPTLVLAHFAIAAIGGFVSPVLFPQIAVILFAPLFFLTATGQFLSLAFRRGITGAVLNLLLALALWPGLWIALGLTAAFISPMNDDLFQRFAKLPWSVNPLMMAGSATNAAVNYHPGRTSHYEMLDDHVSTLEFHAWLLGAAAFYFLAGAATLYAATTRFRQFSGRSN
jgi:ABC-type transport system involved in multi-copper enzyme maturation permease subunit